MGEVERALETYCLGLELLRGGDTLTAGAVIMALTRFSLLGFCVDVESKFAE